MRARRKGGVALVELSAIERNQGSVIQPAESLRPTKPLFESDEAACKALGSEGLPPREAGAR